jgi:hypothetical protein
MGTSRACSWLAVLVVAAVACQRKQPPAALPVSAPLAPDAAPILEPAAAEDEAIFRKVAGAFGCFEREMRKSHQEPAFARYGRTSFTDLFFFDRVLADKAAAGRSEAFLCEGAVKDYRALFLATLARTAGSPSATWAAEGVPVPVDGESEFIRAGQGPTALHVLWHADLTRTALAEMTGGRMRPIFATVRYGAERTDLYRWPDLRYHAQTGPCQPSTCQDESAISQEAFVGLVASTIHDFNEQVRQGSFDQAALYLGIACHALQDAVVHHGMTRRQLAGLRFFADRDYYTTATATASAEAKRWTKRIVALAREAIGDEKLWERFMTWTPPTGFDLAKVANAVFSDDAFNARLNVVNLTRHWLTQRIYQRQPEARQELGPGLIRWDLPPLFDRIRRSVENGGIALRHDRPAR